MRANALIDMENWTFEQSTFCREIRRVNRNRILLAIIVCALIVYLDTIGTIYRVRMSKAEPQIVTHAELAEITDPITQLTLFGFSANHEESAEFDENVRLKRLMLAKNGSCRMVFTPDDFTPIKINSGDDSYIEYALAHLDNGQYVLVKRSAVVKLDTLTGTVGYLPGDLRTIILERSGVDAELLCPLIFDATEEAFGSTGTMIAFSAILLLFWALWFISIIRRSLSLERDPAYQRLFVCHGTVEENARQLDEELGDEDTYRSGRNIVTEHWRIRRRMLSFLVEPVDSEA